MLDMLHFNEPWSRAADGAGAENDGGDAAENDADGAGAAETWKVLVYDTFGRDVISPILRVGDLREQAVTLHMYGTAPRRLKGRSSDERSGAWLGRGTLCLGQGLCGCPGRRAPVPFRLGMRVAPSVWDGLGIGPLLRSSFCLVPLPPISLTPSPSPLSHSPDQDAARRPRARAGRGCHLLCRAQAGQH